MFKRIREFYEDFKSYRAALPYERERIIREEGLNEVATQIADDLRPMLSATHRPYCPNDGGAWADVNPFFLAALPDPPGERKNGQDKAALEAFRERYGITPTYRRKRSKKGKK